jgi:hypothetical protein
MTNTWKFGISNDGWKVASYILVRVVASATHDILKPWQCTLYLTLSTRNYDAEFNYIYRFVVRDNNVNFMDESCGHLQQVEETYVVSGHSSRRSPLFRNLNNTHDGASGKGFSGAGQTINRAGRSLIDDSVDSKSGARRVRIAGEGDLADELGYIEAQLNSSQQQPTPPLQPTLSNGSS